MKELQPNSRIVLKYLLGNKKDHVLCLDTRFIQDDCNLTKEAVAGAFYDLKIHGYVRGKNVYSLTEKAFELLK